MISKLSPFIAGFLIALVGAFFYQNSIRLEKQNSPILSIQAKILDLTLKLDNLESIDTIKKVHNQFSYYYEQSNWNGLSSFLTVNTHFEQALEGVFVGEKSILRNLKQRTPEELNNLIQMQPIVHLSGDGEQGQIRVREFAQLGNFGKKGFWREGIYENIYQKENGTWKLNQLRFYLNILAPYDEGWGRSSIPIESWQEQVQLQPDAPPSLLYESYPGLFIPPFHYSNPVTGLSGAGMQELE